MRSFSVALIAAVCILALASPAHAQMGVEDTVQELLGQAQVGVAVIGRFVLTHFPRFDFSFSPAVTNPRFIFNYTSDFSALMNVFMDVNTCWLGFGARQNSVCSYAQV